MKKLNETVDSQVSNIDFDTLKKKSEDVVPTMERMIRQIIKDNYHLYLFSNPDSGLIDAYYPKKSNEYRIDVKRSLLMDIDRFFPRLHKDCESLWFLKSVLIDVDKRNKIELEWKKLIPNQKGICDGNRYFSIGGTTFFEDMSPEEQEEIFKYLMKKYKTSIPILMEEIKNAE